MQYESTYLHINTHSDIPDTVRIQKHLPSNQADIHLHISQVIGSHNTRTSTHSLLLCESESFVKVDVEICHHCTISTARVCKCTTLFKDCKEEGCLVDV